MENLITAFEWCYQIPISLGQWFFTMLSTKIDLGFLGSLVQNLVNLFGFDVVIDWSSVSLISLMIGGGIIVLIIWRLILSLTPIA